MWAKLPAVPCRVEERFLAAEERLRLSYRRCQDARVEHDTDTPRLVLLGEPLGNLLARHAGLIAYAHLLFAETHRYLTNPSTILLLTDCDAHVMAMVSQPAVLDGAARHSGIRPGSSLREESCGTNGVALALRHREEAAVCGEQHYCRLFLDWCTSGTPVFAIDGGVAACVGAAGSSAHGLGDKLALIKRLAAELGAFLRNSAGYDNHRSEEGHHGLEPRAANGGASPTHLTARQQQVLRLFAKGLSYKQIASRLGIHSTKTIEEHLDAVRTKLGAASRRECIQRASENGLLAP